MTETSVWDRLANLDERETDVLLEVVASIMASHADTPQVAQLRSAPRAVLASELRRSIEAAGLKIDQEKFDRLVNDQAVAREAAVTALSTIDPNSELAGEIADAFAARIEMLVFDPVTILAVAVLVLAVKVKAVEVGGFRVDFARLNNGAARYIDERSDPYRLPSMELQGLINSPEAFRTYLEGAL